MNIYPAIDIIDGQAVRLLRGDYEKKTAYGSPLDIALDFLAEGSKRIHIVDLDGARTGEAPNLGLITKIASETGLFVEVGGGIRSLERIREYLDGGVSRVILGTAAITDPRLLEDSARLFGSRIAVGADALDGRVKIKGWRDDSGLTLDELINRVTGCGIKTVICTDISRDGAMLGTNIPLYKRLKEQYNIELIASGGVSSMRDIAALSDAGVDGCIIGKAYYTGAIKLKEALKYDN